MAEIFDLNLVSQYYKHIEEMEWTIEEFLKTDLPVASSGGPPPQLHMIKYIYWNKCDIYLETAT